MLNPSSGTIKQIKKFILLLGIVLKSGDFGIFFAKKSFVKLT